MPSLALRIESVSFSIYSSSLAFFISLASCAEIAMIIY
jgi:hypothetical protein